MTGDVNGDGGVNVQDIIVIINWILDGDYSSATTDAHIGYEGSLSETADFYVQGGPAFVATDGADTETELSGKVGVSIAATESFGVYGEISGITNEDSSGDGIVDWGAKLGGKFTF